MAKRTPQIVFAVLAALMISANVPGVSWAQSSQVGQAPSGQSYTLGQQGQINQNRLPGPPGAGNSNRIGDAGRQTPLPKGGVATVISVDHPENCLRIRSGPGTYYDVIGCANLGAQLNITGVWTSNDWAQLADNGWVYGRQIQTDLRPPRTAYSQIPNYIVTEEIIPEYGDWGYLPDYGYETYWYGGIPIYFYGLNVWQRFHPWWWHRGHQAWWWKGNHHGKRAWNAGEFENYARARSRRNFTTNRANISLSNLNRFNTNRFGRSGPGNVFRSRAFSNPNRFGSGSRNAFRSGSFSAPSVLRGGRFRAGQFGGISRPRSFSGARIGGGGFHFGGGRFGGIGRMGGGGGRRR